MASFNKYFSILLKHLAPVGLFVVLPLLAALWLGHNIIIQERDKHVLELSTRIENNLKEERRALRGISIEQYASSKNLPFMMEAQRSFAGAAKLYTERVEKARRICYNFPMKERRN